MAESKSGAVVKNRPIAKNRRKQSPSPTALRNAHSLCPKTFPLLHKLGRNLTEAAAEGEIDPVIGREKELNRILDVLGQRRANNPVLVGPAGVGKTALVEGLALQQVMADADEAKIIIELSAGSLISGTGVRGALSEKLAALRNEVARAEGKVLLFIDEIHAIVGQGEGPDDLASELKSALARGSFTCLGATTEAEYKRSLEKDPALERRFSRIDVLEPSKEEAVEILKGIAPGYEKHHGVTYSAAALRASVELSARYLPEGCLPDKAISLLDLAAARVRRKGEQEVEHEAIAEVVSERASIPLERLMMRDADRLLNLETHLHEHIVGQVQPIESIADSLRKGAAGFRGKRPLGTFLLLGPTGVGKTETAKAIAELLFSKRGMTRLDMSEFSEAHTVARLLGSPPGYVGHEEGGQLTEAVRRKPYQLLLLDEIEKAHPEVLLALLPLLDEGRLTDAQGRTVDFTNTVIVMTSNLGVAKLTERKARVGFGGASTSPERPDLAAQVLAAAQAALPPELWNRIDEPLFFGPLSRTEVGTIASRLLGSVSKMMAAEHQIELKVQESAISALIAAGGFDPLLGARPMRRCIGRLVEAKLASALLSGRLVRGEEVTLWGSGDDIRIGLAGEREAAE